MGAKVAVSTSLPSGEIGLTMEEYYNLQFPSWLMTHLNEYVAIDPKLDVYFAISVKELKKKAGNIEYKNIFPCAHSSSLCTSEKGRKWN